MAGQNNMNDKVRIIAEKDPNLSDILEFDMQQDELNYNPLKMFNINSDYHDIENILKEQKGTMPYKYKCMHANIQSLPSKFDILKFILTRLNEMNLKLDFIFLCETFLSKNNENHYNLPGYKLVPNSRKDMTKGGVAIYIRNDLKYKERPDLDIFVEGEFETVFVEILSESHSCIIGEIYRIPNTNEIISINRFENILQSLQTSNKDIIIATDQNFDYLKIHEHKNTSDLLNAFLNGNMLPTITKPTRITHNTATLIDNIYVKLKDYSNIYSGIIQTHISDHLPVFAFVGSVRLGNSSKQKEKLTFKHRSLTEQSLNRIKLKLSELNWDSLHEMTVENAYSFISTTITDILDHEAPYKQTTIKPKYIIREKWMTKGLLTSSLNLDKLYRKATRVKKTSITHQSFIKYRNLFNTLKRKAKRKYYRDMLLEYKNDIRQTWKILKNVLNKTNDKSSISQEFVADNGTLVCDPKSIGNHFCNFFTNVGPTFASAIPASKFEFSHFLKRRHDKTFFF